MSEQEMRELLQELLAGNMDAEEVREMDIRTASLERVGFLTRDEGLYVIVPGENNRRFAITVQECRR